MAKRSAAGGNFKWGEHPISLVRNKVYREARNYCQSGLNTGFDRSAKRWNDSFSRPPRA